MIHNIDELLAQAESTVDKAREIFLKGFGATIAYYKEECDFTTSSDLEIEKLLRQELEEKTGIPVLGEEYGGNVDQYNLFWIVDPIDGTANYAASNPQAAILVSLIEKGTTIIAITDIPFFNKRVVTIENTLYVNGEKIEAQKISRNHGEYAYGRLNAPGRHEILGKILEKHKRVRISGSVGIDHAFTALGIYDGCITFSPNLWDNAAGVAHMKAAGLIVTDLSDQPWNIYSQGVVGAIEPMHRTFIQCLTEEK